MLDAPSKGVKEVVRFNRDENIIDGAFDPTVVVSPLLASIAMAILNLVANWTNMDFRTFAAVDYQNEFDYI